ncbi:hypothetical protein ACMBCM_05540, partial [Spiroplasma sp. K1]
WKKNNEKRVKFNLQPLKSTQQLQRPVDHATGDLEQMAELLLLLLLLLFRDLSLESVDLLLLASLMIAILVRDCSKSRALLILLLVCD